MEPSPENHEAIIRLLEMLVVGVLLIGGLLLALSLGKIHTED